MVERMPKPKSRIKLCPISPYSRSAQALWEKSSNGIKLPLNERTLERVSFVPGKNGKPKGLIARTFISDIEGAKTAYLVYYPKPEHFGHFELSRTNTFGNPAGIFPGSVGSAFVRQSEGNYSVFWMQSSFKTGVHSSMNRSLASEYGGWRHRILEQVFGEAVKSSSKVSFRLPGELWGEKSVQEMLKSQPSIRPFAEVAEKNGFKLRKEGEYLIAERK